MYGVTTAVSGCTSAKDFVEIVRGQAAEPMSGRKSTTGVGRWGIGTRKAGKGGISVLRCFGNWIFHNLK